VLFRLMSILAELTSAGLTVSFGAVRTALLPTSAVPPLPVSSGSSEA
jgi:hypothetical protein